MDKGYYKKSEYTLLWLHLILKANHKPKEFWFNGKNVRIKRGQFLTGRKVLSNETGINESKIERILNFFEKSEQQIEQQKTNRNRLITILSYNQYNLIKQQIEQPVNNNRTTSEQLVNTTNNEKNDKNENNIKDIGSLKIRKGKKIKEFVNQWNKRKEWYMEKYPNLDYELFFKNIVSWIYNDWNKAKYKRNINLFIQNCLNREKPNYNIKKTKTDYNVSPPGNPSHEKCVLIPVNPKDVLIVDIQVRENKITKKKDFIKQLDLSVKKKYPGKKVKEVVDQNTLNRYNQTKKDIELLEDEIKDLQDELKEIEG